MTTFLYTIPLIEDFEVRREPDVSVQLRFFGGVNSSSFRVNPPEPDFGLYTMYDPITGRKLFDGSVAQYTNEYEDAVSNAVHSVTGIDHTWAFNKYRPFGNWLESGGIAGVSATYIASGLIAAYAPAFTGNHIQTGLPRVAISFDGSETMMQAVLRLAQVVGNVRTYLDFDYDLHFYRVDPPTLPTASGSGRAGPATAMVVAKSATPVTGLHGIVPGWRMFTYAFLYDDVDVNGRNSVISDFAPWSAPVFWDFDFSGVTPQGQVDYTGLLTGSPVSGHSVIARIIFVVSNFGCRAVTVWNDVNDNVTTSGTIDIYTNPNPNVSSPYLPWIFPLAQPATAPTAPVNAPTVSDGIFSGAAYPNGKWVFALAFVNDQGEESGLGPSSAVWSTDGLTKSPDFSSLDLGPADTVSRRIYASYALSSQPDPDFTTNLYSIYGWMFVPDNTSTSMSTATQIALQPMIDWRIAYSLRFITNTSGWPDSTPFDAGSSLGPNPEDDPAELPEDVTDASLLLLKDAPFQVTYDKMQVRNRVFVRGASTPADADAAVGVSTIVLPVGHPFGTSGAGQVQIRNRVYTYGYSSATSIALTTPLIDALTSGDPVYIWAEANHTESQTYFAAREDDDGIHEYTIIDSSLTTVEDCGRRALAELAIYALPLVEVRYTTHDVKSMPGKTVIVNMTNPRCSATLLIQSVDVDQININGGSDTQDLPVFHVTASSMRFSVDDFMRTSQLIDPATLAPTTGLGG